MPNRFTAAVSYDLPIGRGKSILENANRWVDAFIGGWQINDETIIENGGPLPVVQTNLSAGAFGTTGVGGTNQRPNLIPGVSPCYSGRPQSRLGGSSGLRPYLNLNAFTPALPYTYGNAPRTLNCYGPGFNNSDLSINKSFKVTEKASFQVRAEALNASTLRSSVSPATFLPSATAPLHRRPIRLLRVMLKRAKIRDFWFHDLRHTFASWYMMNGGDLYELAKILGHANIKMTERYAKLGPAHIAKTGNTAKVIWNMLDKKTEQEEGEQQGIA
jgi:hypothetical protein